MVCFPFNSSFSNDCQLINYPRFNIENTLDSFIFSLSSHIDCILVDVAFGIVELTNTFGFADCKLGTYFFE